MHSPLAPDKHSSVPWLSVALFTVNVIGAITYVIRASPSWAITQERGLHSATGEPFVWASSVLLIVVGFAMLNLLWGAYICFKKRWGSGYVWLMAAAVWLVAICIDFAHH
jgi:hypothetical protein